MPVRPTHFELYSADPKATVDFLTKAFGWQALEIDGHSFPQLFHALEVARSTRGRPTVLIARTVKGKGVSFMENNPEFHGKAPTPAELEQALKELA